jgi:hypothetical protein
MKRISVALALIVSGLFVASYADAKKPTICMAYSESTLPIEGVATKVAICTDGKKPVVLTSYTITTVKDENGASVKAVVGWR